MSDDLRVRESRSLPEADVLRTVEVACTCTLRWATRLTHFQCWSLVIVV